MTVRHIIHVQAEWVMRKKLQIRQAVDAYQNVKTHMLILFVQAKICAFVMQDMTRIE
jgi:hypothetical protein